MKKGKISKVQPVRAFYIGSQSEWNIFTTNHSEQRANEREIPYPDMIFNISLIIDFFVETGINKDICEYSRTEKWSHLEKRVQVRDDINDTCYILKFYPDEKELHIITCINQKTDRELTCKKHTSLKPDMLAVIIDSHGYSMYITSADENGFALELIKSEKLLHMEEYKM